MNTPTNIPKDGYYSAMVYQDTGGAIRTPVQVDLGKVFNQSGGELLLEACSEFEEMPLRDAVTAWPDEHAGIIESLRNDVRELNVVLADWRQQIDVLRRDEWVGAACLHLLAEHGVPIGSHELLAAKDRVEAEMQSMKRLVLGRVGCNLELIAALDGALEHIPMTLQGEARAVLARAKGQP